MGHEILVFEVANRLFGVRSGCVVEVVRAVTLSPLPRTSTIAEGLLNLRGCVVPVIDIRRVFDLPPKEIEHTDHLIVVRDVSALVALRVDRATDLANCPENSHPAVDGVLLNCDFVSTVMRIEDRIIHVLDIGRLLPLVRGVTPTHTAAEAGHEETRN